MRTAKALKKARRETAEAKHVVAEVHATSGVFGPSANRRVTLRKCLAVAFAPFVTLVAASH
eukprot:8236268-Alexandrium_andersonii.AAC.1